MFNYKIIMYILYIYIIISYKIILINKNWHWFKKNLFFFLINKNLKKKQFKTLIFRFNLLRIRDSNEK